MSWLTLLFAFSGRFRRGDFFFVFCLANLYVLLVGLLQLVLAPNSSPSNVTDIFLEIAMLPALIALVAAIVKRLHDRNRSVWWLILYLAIFFLLAEGSDYLQSISTISNVDTSVMNMILFVLLAVLGVWGQIELFFVRGTVGDNAYGPDPLGDRGPPAS